MSELQFEAEGGKVRIEGNSEEKTFCGGIEIYDDKLVIKQKGTFLSKGEIVVRYDTIQSISVSGNLSAQKLRIITKSNDYYVSAFHTKVRSESPEEVVGKIRSMIDDVQSAPTDVRITGKEESVKSAADEIEKLAELNEKGIITDQEFQKKKDELL